MNWPEAWIGPRLCSISANGGGSAEWAVVGSENNEERSGAAVSSDNALGGPLAANPELLGEIETRIASMRGYARRGSMRLESNSVSALGLQWRRPNSLFTLSFGIFCVSLLRQLSMTSIPCICVVYLSSDTEALAPWNTPHCHLMRRLGDCLAPQRPGCLSDEIATAFTNWLPMLNVEIDT